MRYWLCSLCPFLCLFCGEHLLSVCYARHHRHRRERPSEPAFLSTKTSFYRIKTPHLHLHLVDTCQQYRGYVVEKLYDDSNVSRDPGGLPNVPEYTGQILRTLLHQHVCDGLRIFGIFIYDCISSEWLNRIWICLRKGKKKVCVRLLLLLNMKVALIKFRIALSCNCTLQNVFQFYIFIVTFVME